MALQNIGRASALSPFRKREAIARTLTDRNVYSKMGENQAIKRLLGGDEAIRVIGNGRKD